LLLRRPLRRARDGVRLVEAVQVLAEQPQRLGSLLLLAATRLSLEVDLVPQRHKLAEQCVQVGAFLGGGGERDVRRQGAEPGAEVAEDVLDPLPGQGLRRTDSSDFSGTRRRGLRHAISSSRASIVSRLPASNRRYRSRVSTSRSFS